MTFARKSHYNFISPYVSTKIKKNNTDTSSNDQEKIKEWFHVK